MANDRTNMVSLLDFGKWMDGDASNILELGDGYTELTEDWSPNTNETTYVNMKTAATTVNGYALSMTPEREHLSDEAQEYIDRAFRKFPTGKSAETDYYRFYKTGKSGDGFLAIKVPVVAMPTSTGGTGGETLTSSIQISGNGDAVDGIMKIEEGKWTFTETPDAEAAAYKIRKNGSASLST